jgi:hypothetical protein
MLTFKEKRSRPRNLFSAQSSPGKPNQENTSPSSFKKHFIY